MMSAPRHVKVELTAPGICYLSNEPPFHIIINWELNNTEQRVIFLEDGFVGSEQYQPINSNQVIQCFDDETGERVQVLQQGAHAVFLDGGPTQFTTSNSREEYELSFITSSLLPDKKYRLCFKPTESISHWPASSEPALNSLAATGCSDRPADIPAPSSEPIPWEADGRDTIFFETRRSRPRMPKVTVSIAAPPTYSLTKPFRFSLTFSTDAAYPLTVHADRRWVKLIDSDIEILDAASRVRLAPNMDVCRDDDDYSRRAFVTIEDSFTEHRELDLSDPFWDGVALEVGREYVLSHVGGRWWWTDESMDNVIKYLASKGNLGLARTEDIEFAGAGEVFFTVVD